MKSRMRIAILLICSALMIKGVNAQTLTEADREALLDSLEKLRDAAMGKVDSKFRVALAAFRSASGSDDAAMELYLNCVERVNFEEKEKKSAEFREWKRNKSDELSDPGFRVALRMQLRWLILTLESFPDDADRAKLSDEARQVLDSIFGSAKKFSNQQGLLSEAVMSTVFARAYEISHLKVEKWPSSPVNLEAIYGELIMPPLRTPSKVKELQAAWIKRIQQEGAVAEYWTVNRGPGQGRKQGAATMTTTEAAQRFLEDTKPKLQWEMELDLFRNGDESGAATRMLAFLEKNLANPAAKTWSEELKALLTAEAPSTETTGNPPVIGNASP